ncbi:hypothetical protein BHE74_00030568 [Ensete ventricosum]|nr:hypothetical protein BHE74_00030568 [Ensete ventricosum]
MVGKEEGAVGATTAIGEDYSRGEKEVKGSSCYRGGVVTLHRAAAAVATTCVGRRGRWDGSNGKGGRGSNEGTSMAKESSRGAAGSHDEEEAGEKAKEAVVEAAGSSS